MRPAAIRKSAALRHAAGAAEEQNSLLLSIQAKSNNQKAVRMYNQSLSTFPAIKYKAVAEKKVKDVRSYYRMHK